MKERAAVGPKDSGLPRDPDFRRTTVFKLCSVALQPKLDLECLTVEVSISHAIRHKRARAVGLLWTSNHLMADVVT